MFRRKRVYDEAAPDDGYRVLVDRRWPRGFRRESLPNWLPAIAPSLTLCDWYGHAPDRFPEFRRRYRAELGANPEAVAEIERRASDGPVTLLFAARDAERSNAAVLQEWLEERADRSPRRARVPGARSRPRSGVPQRKRASRPRSPSQGRRLDGSVGGDAGLPASVPTAGPARSIPRHEPGDTS